MGRGGANNPLTLCANNDDGDLKSERLLVVCFSDKLFPTPLAGEKGFVFTVSPRGLGCRVSPDAVA